MLSSSSNNCYASHCLYTGSIFLSRLLSLKNIKFRPKDTPVFKADSVAAVKGSFGRPLGAAGKSTWFADLSVVVKTGSCTQTMRLELPVRATLRADDAAVVLSAISDITGAFKVRTVVCIVLRHANSHLYQSECICTRLDDMHPPNCKISEHTQSDV